VPIPLSRTTLAALLALAAPVSAAAQDVRGVVFAASGANGDTAWIEPVAILLTSGYMEPHAEEISPFRDAWMQPGRRYDVLSRGEPVARMTIGGTAVEGCGGLSAQGPQQGRAPLRLEQQGLAGEGLPAQHGAPWLRTVSSAERGQLDRMAAALFDAHGIDLAQRPRADTATAALLIHPNARPVLVGTYARATQSSPLQRKAALLVIAEDGARGYRPAYVRFNEEVEDDMQSSELVDAADLDGDGMPELVIRTTYYEGWDYTILSRTEAGWIEVHRGGGTGC
jgi:hypothetical protein